MKVRYCEPEELTRSQYVHMCSTAAVAAVTELELEDLYTPDNSDCLWETAWNAAYNAIYSNASTEEATELAIHAARRHALAIPGCRRRWELVRAGRIVPARLLA